MFCYKLERNYALLLRSLGEFVEDVPLLPLSEATVGMGTRDACTFSIWSVDTAEAL